MGQLAETASSPRRNKVAGASNELNETPDAVARIVAVCQEGDRAAQRQLTYLCHQRVYRLAARMVGLQDVCDVTQQAFLQVFRNIEQFSGHSKLKDIPTDISLNPSKSRKER